ncbi:MAG: hypothetical protein ACREUU_01590, partial [Gammaproteobacteria bacterium]
SRRPSPSHPALRKSRGPVSRTRQDWDARVQGVPLLTGEYDYSSTPPLAPRSRRGHPRPSLLRELDYMTRA